MMQQNENSSALPQAAIQAPPQMPARPALIKKSTAILFISMAFALGLYGGHLISSLVNEEEPRITRQSIRQAAQTAPNQAAQTDLAALERLTALRAAAEAPSATAADWNRLGHLYYEQKRLEDAVAAYTRSLALEPDDSTVMTHMGILYRGLHRHERALEFFRMAAQADPANETALYYIGIACLDVNNRADAITAWQTLQKHNPGFVTPMGPTISQALEMLKQQ